MGFTRLVHKTVTGTGYQIKLLICQNIFFLFVLCHKISASTACALVFPLLMIEQHNTFSFWNREPNKSQELLKDLALSLFYVQNACFSFPNSGTAHHFQRINDFRLSNFITRNRSAAKISQVLCSIVHILSFLAFQPLHHRFQG